MRANPSARLPQPIPAEYIGGPDSVVSITIGRNIVEQPMDEDVWEQFQKKVIELVGYPTTTSISGCSSWQGVPEETFQATWIGYYLNIIEIRKGLADLAVCYGQDAIALTYGKCELVG